jgi:serine protease inhibitor
MSTPTDPGAAAVAAAGAALAAACSGGGVAPVALSSLGAALAARASLEAAAANLIISPLSIYLALVLALNAAGVGSRTQAELLRALCAASQVGRGGYASLAPGGGIPPGDAAAAEAAINADASQLARALMSPPPPPPPPSAASNRTNAAAAAAPAGPELLLANSLWTQNGPAGAVNVSADYASRMASLLGAVARKGGAADVNAWAREATKGLVPQAVAPGTRFDLLLANAVYFKGKWERAFRKEETLADAEFRGVKVLPAAAAAGAGAGAGKAAAAAAAASAPPPLSWAPKKVQMMQLRVTGPEDRTALRLKQRGPLIMLTSRFIAVRLPYAGGKQSAVLVLPLDKESPEALRSLVAKGGGGPAGGAPLDWRRDLALAPVPGPWIDAVSNATGRPAAELRRRAGGPLAVVPRAPALPRDDGDRVLPSPRLVAGGPGDVGAATGAMPMLPMGEQWLPPSVRSSGGLELRVPKFRAETTQLRLKAALSDASSSGLSIRAAFDPSAADFSRAAERGGDERLAIDDVIHSAVVVVDEEGTEAAAATAVVMMRAAMPMVEEDPPIRVVLDRPFLFGVVDDATGTPMFTGVVNDPEWREASA